MADFLSNIWLRLISYCKDWWSRPSPCLSNRSKQRLRRCKGCRSIVRRSVSAKVCSWMPQSKVPQLRLMPKQPLWQQFWTDKRYTGVFSGPFWGNLGDMILRTHSKWKIQQSIWQKWPVWWCMLSYGLIWTLKGMLGYRWWRFIRQMFWGSHCHRLRRSFGLWTWIIILLDLLCSTSWVRTCLDSWILKGPSGNKLWPKAKSMLK